MPLGPPTPQSFASQLACNVSGGCKLLREGKARYRVGFPR
jgi:hypothetical protein